MESRAQSVLYQHFTTRKRNKSGTEGKLDLQSVWEKTPHGSPFLKEQTFIQKNKNRREVRDTCVKFSVRLFTSADIQMVLRYTHAGKMHDAQERATHSHKEGE